MLIPEEKLKKRVEELARELSERYRGEELLALVLLKGAFVFAADLLRGMRDVEISCDFVKASSYGDSKRSCGEVKLTLLPTQPVGGKKVLLVDDILDTGRTLKKVKEWVLEQGAASCETCVLLDKPERREVDFSADYVGFVIPNYFVVGYGMDYAEKYRTLPFVAVVE